MATPLHSETDAARGRLRPWWILMAAVLATVCGGIAYWKWPATRPLPPKSFSHDDALSDEMPVQNRGFVGIEACASCHAERVAEFKTTTHFHACRPPEPGDMPAGFTPGHGVYSARNAALKFESRRSGDHFTQTAILTTPEGEKRSSVDIDLMYGTGNGDQIYFTWKDDRLFELPVAWLFPFNRWAEQPFDPYGSGNFLRTTTPRCLECHNTWIGHIPGSENQYQRSGMLLGITCEKCHGPGREHVAFHQAHPEAKTGEFVVKPRQLSRDRYMDLCGQCHSNAPKRRGPPFTYRPGEPLEKYFRTAADSNQEDEHVANQVRYLRESKCYQKNESLTCVTCHNPHRPTTPAEKAAGARRSCQKCHQESDCHARERLPLAVRNDCVNCHMPRFTRIQVYFHVAEDQYVPPIRPHQHRIGVYQTATQEVLLNWHRSQPGDSNRREAVKLAKSLTAHWQTEAEKFRKEYRFLAAIGAYREALRIDPSPEIRTKLDEVIAIKAKIDGDWFKALHEIDQRQFSIAIDTLNGILKEKPNLAKAHGRLGTLYANANRNDLAIEHFREAAKDDPDDPQGEMMLAWLAFLEGNFKESVAHYERANEIDPFNVKINYLWGTALAKLERWPEATERFRETLKIDPNHEGGCLSLAVCLDQQKKPAEALRYAQRAARLTHFENADALLALAEIYAALDRLEEADDIVAKAFALPEAKVEPETRKRLQEIRTRARRGLK